jgi:hypothetical protein
MNFGDSPKYSTQPLVAVKCLHDPYQLPTYNANDLKNVISRQPEAEILTVLFVGSEL